MPSAFDKRFVRSGAPQLQRQFGELVTYQLRSGGTRSVTAIIERNPPAIYSDTGDIVRMSFIIRIPNDAAEGVLASEVDTGGDTVKIIRKLGDKVPATFVVDRIVDQSGGMLVLGVK